MFVFKCFYQQRPRKRPRQKGVLKSTLKPANERTARAKRASTLTTRDNFSERPTEKPRGHERACGRPKGGRQRERAQPSTAANKAAHQSSPQKHGGALARPWGRGKGAGASGEPPSRPSGGMLAANKAAPKSSPQWIGRGGTTGAGYGRPPAERAPQGAGHNMAGC